jgi:hypothetical protein
MSRPRKRCPHGSTYPYDDCRECLPNGENVRAVVRRRGALSLQEAAPYFHVTHQGVFVTERRALKKLRAGDE